MAGGYRSLLGVWVGGAGAAGHGGCRSLLAFWMGGACGIAPVSIGGAISPSGGGGGVFEGDYQARKRKRIRRDDEEILFILAAFLGDA